MRANRRLLWLGVLAGVLSFAPSGHAQSTVTMTLTTPAGYDPNFPNDAFAGVYVNPYVATITPTGGTPYYAIPVICDDFADDTYLNETWGATVLNPTVLSELQQARMYTQISGTAADKLVAYERVAWLCEQLVTYNNPAVAGAALQRAYISFAIWSVFDKTGVDAWATSHSDLAGALAVSAGTVGSIKWWLAQATANAQASDLAQITIYSPSLDTSTYVCPTGCPNKPAQEFIVVKAADAPPLETLGLNLFGLGALILVARKRINWVSAPSRN